MSQTDTTSLEAAKEKLRELVSLFRDNIAVYKDAARYDEANTRVDFIDKFFEILGWDVRNVNGYSELARDVIREDRVYVDGRPKAPDYAFRAIGKTQFFVEAKKPSVNIRDAIDPAFQLRRYGRTAKLSLSLLTDFEEFAVYDTRITPHKDDKASVSRVFYCTFEEYEKNFDYIYSTFSKNAVLRGSFDRYIEATKNKRGTSEVDDEILALVEDWRLTLAKNIAKLNPDLDEYHINLAVQRVVDRILFLRIAEDRSIEPYETLRNAAKSKGVYQQLHTIFAQAAERYNAGLFQHETWLDNIRIDDKVLVPIITKLYYPESPYEFAVLPIEILGSVYERCLGKTIRLTLTHQAKVEEKPEVRKAGGVYYTPQYIVDYIIRETIGRKVENKLPAAIATLAILDPACGSGSFLVGAYTFLLDWYLAFYSSNGELKKSLKRGVIYEAGVATYRISIEEKQRILLRHIYGVDIDPIAVEVTKLSLYLKLLEHETEASRDHLFRHSDLKMLPNLDANIQCGNSLIASDFYRDKDLALLGQKEMRKINTFDWDKTFPQILGNGGFDCVIGNPPWGQKAAKFTDDEKEYLQQMLPTASIGILDLSRFFIEKSIALLKKDGIWGQVLPDIILLKNYESTRQFLLKNLTIRSIDHWGKAFRQVNIEACTITANNTPLSGRRKIKVGIHKETDILVEHKIDQRIFSKLPGCKFNLHLTDSAWSLLQKFSSLPTFCESFDVHEGIHSGNVRDKLFVKKKLNAQCKKLIFGRDEIQRYHLTWQGGWVHYSRKVLQESDYAGLGRSEYFEAKKLVIRRTGDYVLSCLDDVGYYFSNNAFVCVPKSAKINLRYYLCILNSRLLTWYYRTMQPRVGKMFAEIKINLINQFPVPALNLADKKSKQQHDRLVSLVDQMLTAHEQQRAAISTNDRALCDKRINALDAQINRIVYELYGLTEEEVKIVEGG